MGSTADVRAELRNCAPRNVEVVTLDYYGAAEDSDEEPEEEGSCEDEYADDLMP